MEISFFHPVLAFLTPTAVYFPIIRSNRIICTTPTHLGCLVSIVVNSGGARRDEPFYQIKILAIILFWGQMG